MLSRAFYFFKQFTSRALALLKRNGPHAARSPGRMLDSVRSCLSPSMCLHLSPARSPGRMPVSVRIYLSSSMGLHVSAEDVLAICPCYWIVGPHARQRAHIPCLPVCAFIRLPVLPDPRAACSAVRTCICLPCFLLVHERVHRRRIKMFIQACSPSAHKSVACGRTSVFAVGAHKFSSLANKRVPRWRARMFLVCA